MVSEMTVMELSSPPEIDDEERSMTEMVSLSFLMSFRTFFFLYD